MPNAGDLGGVGAVNYYRRYSGDYLRKTARLSMVEHGAYGLLLDYYYSEEQPLPLDQQEIYTMARALRPEDRKAVDKVLSLFFVKKDDGYHNIRADEEISKAQPAIKAAKENGRKGGRRANPTGYAEEPTGLPEEEPTGLHGGLEAGQHPPSSILHPPTPTPQPPTPKRSKADAIATRLPADWTLPREWSEWAEKDRGWSADTARLVADGFKDFWIAKAGKDAKKLDWLATWRNWCRNQRVAPAKISAPRFPI